MSTVTWVQDSNGNYEISSPEHLKQLMNEGTLYSDSGTPPTDYFSSNYIQTVDIDLLSDSTDITPIGGGLTGTVFTGNYDGGGFRISNWYYQDPEFNTSNDCIDSSGIFGLVRGELKNLIIDGLFKLQGTRIGCGVLMGSSYGTCNIENIIVDTAPGSFVDPGVSTYNVFNFGGVANNLNGTMTRATFKGTIDVGPVYSRGFLSTTMGGIVAYCINSTMNGLQNLGTFTSPLKGGYTGGIIGLCNNGSSMTNCINAMIGDLESTSFTGGVLGYCRLPIEINTLVNSMTGNITSITYAGGIAGYIESSSGSHTMINYSDGNISSDNNTREGGLIGYLKSDNFSLTNSINAMRGNVRNSVVGLVDGSSPSILATVDQSFGLTFTTNSYSTTSPPSGMITTSGFPDLPYVTLSATGTDGVSHELDFIYANVGGNSSYSAYTHLVLHRGVVSAPFDINFSIPPGSTELYLTFINANNETFEQPSLTVALPSGTFTVDARSVNIVVEIGPLPGAIGFRVTIEGPTGGETTLFTGSTSIKYNLVNLEPETPYTVRIYTDTGNGYVSTGDQAVTTLANTSSNFVPSDFEHDGVFDLRALDENRRGQLSSTMKDIFSTGDVVRVTPSNKKDLDASFIKLGETLSIKQITGVILPFDEASGSGQTVSVTLSDDSTNVPINFDETSNTVTVELATYSPGDTFILDGKKVKVLDY